MKACLLWRLGEIELARHALEISNTPVSLLNSDRPDPYLILAEDWMQSLYDRALCAHMRGDDATALERLRVLSRVNQLIESEAEKRGVKRPLPDPKAGNAKPPYFYFLAKVPSLLADQERRALEPSDHSRPHQAFVFGSANYPNHKVYISALVKDLDQVCARQSGQPGGVNLSEDPIVRELITQGDDAVEPLLDVFENDERLTRSVHFHRDFMPDRNVIGVHEAAYTALIALLQTQFFAPRSTGDNLSKHRGTVRQDMARQMREYWQKYRGMALGERWFQILCDGESDPHQWLVAASKITNPPGRTIPGSMYETQVEPSQSNQPTSPNIALLRRKQNPSVTELMVKRTFDLIKIPAFDPAVSTMRGCRMALLLMQWEPSGALPVLQTLSIKCNRNRTKKGGSGSTWGHELNRDYARLLKARIKLGDPKAQAELQSLQTEGPLPETE